MDYVYLMMVPAHETQIKNVQIVQIIGKQYAIHFIMLKLTSNTLSVSVVIFLGATITWNMHNVSFGDIFPWRTKAELSEEVTKYLHDFPEEMIFHTSNLHLLDSVGQGKKMCEQVCCILELIYTNNHGVR